MKADGVVNVEPSKHRHGIVTADGRTLTVSTTHRPSWLKRRDNRRRNKAARASRRVNR